MQDPPKYEDECAKKHLLELDPKNVGKYVLMPIIYAMKIWWDVVAKMIQMMKNKGIQKVPYSSWIQVNNKVHAFLEGDISHSQTQEIYVMFEGLSRKMEEAGYMPYINSIPHNVDVEEKKPMVFHTFI